MNYVSSFSFSKVVFSILTLSFFVSGFVSAENIDKYEGISQKFQVSAYYSPQPNQEKYVSGSYAVDLKMNGNGTHGADGTPVYIGMISAPSKYAFGTQLYIPGLGIGTVHDRGGAIYASKGYDRLDVWMGKGDAGRIRALQWGRRTVDGVILTKKISNTLHISTAEIARVYAKKSNQKEASIRKIVFTRNFSRGDKNEEVKKIQKFLIEEGVFSGDLKVNEVTRYYGSQTENSVFLFQKTYNIVSNWSDAGAGNWGPKTRAKANSL